MENKQTKNRDKIDILLATYNGQDYIKEQIESILNQTYTNFHIYISDDNSTDKTIEILEEYRKENSGKITIFKHNENLGGLRNFAFLLEQVKSDFYMLCDQDDVWFEDKILKSYNKLIDDDLDMVFTDLEVVDDNLRPIYPSMFVFLNIHKRLKKYNDYRLIYLDNCITGCTMISRSKFLEDILPVPVTTKYLLHDYWIALVIAIKGKFSYIDEPLIKYRQHGKNQVGVRKTSSKFKTFKEVRDLFILVKKERFQAFVDNDRVFGQELKKLNSDALNYFANIEKKKHINFRGWVVFSRVYKYEKITRKIGFFVIMNIPVVANIIFKIRYMILKSRKK